jgi:hypothetical protein
MPARLDTAVTSYANVPQIGFDGQGNAFAVWGQEDPSNGGIATVWASTMPAGGSWTAPASLDSSAPSTGTGFTGPQLAVNANGTAVAVWDQTADAGNTYSPWASIYTPGSGWSAAVQVDSPAGNARRAPRVAIDPNGNAAMVWIDGSTSGFTWVMGSRFAVGGGGWSSPVRLSIGMDAGSGSNDTFPDIAMDAQGNAKVVWSTDNGAHAIWTARFVASSGTWSSPTTIAECPGCALWPVAHVAVDAAGDAFAVWTWDAVTGGEQVYASHFTACSSWSAPVQLDANLPTGTTDGYERIAVNASGQAVVVWMDYAVNGGHPTYPCASRWTGASWTSAVQLGAAPYGGGIPHPAVADNGDALVVWTGPNLLESRFISAGSSAWGPQVALTAGAMLPGNAVVAFAPGSCGVGLAAWDDNVGSLRGVFTSFYR